MAGRLKGKVAIVTGGGTEGEGVGNGKAAAILFAREGARVAVADLVLSRAQESVDHIKKEGGEAFAIQADVSMAGDCKRMVEATVAQYGRVDILHNNVGITIKGNVLEVTDEVWDQVMAINVRSVMLCARYAIPEMKKAGGGSIINIASTAGLRAHSANSSIAYAASKGGVIAMTHAMAADHGRDNIRVNCIAPGLVETPLAEKRLTEEGRLRRRSTSPLGIQGTAWDIGWAAVFLASDEARWITGVVLPVDGGLTVTTPATYLNWGKPPTS